MIRERRAAVEAVSAAFLPAEAAAETAAALAARCVATMIEERSRANLPIATGRSAMALMAEAVQLSLAARAKMVEAHLVLGGLPAEIGIHGYGGDDCPPNEPFTSATLGLRAVG